MKSYHFIADKSAQKSILRRKICTRLVASHAVDATAFHESGVDRFYLPDIQKYWSLSFTDEAVVGILSSEKVGIDLARITPRDLVLLEMIPSTLEKTWEHFFMLWTAKESIIKAYDLNLWDHDTITYIDHSETETRMRHNGKIISCMRYSEADFMISICVRNTRA